MKGLYLLKTLNRKLLTYQEKESSRPRWFSYKFYQTLKTEMIPILHNLFQKIEVDGTLPNSFYEASVALTPKPDKDIIRKENCSISHEHNRYKSPQKI